MTHELKTYPKYFQETIEGNKPFEIRKNDRNFQVGDVLILKEWDNIKYSGDPCSRREGSPCEDRYGITEYQYESVFEKHLILFILTKLE